MKLLLLLPILATLVLSNSDCQSKKAVEKMRGRLEIAGICSNYTIRVLEGDPGKDAVEANWTDETTGKQYDNVFRLENPCDFPATIKQGDEFYFVIDSSSRKPCTVCMAYYPTPAKKLPIKVIP
ncbi:MAG TPA: hypothetical protein PLO99_02190 [Chitinophagaceae bacterium]|nr:hypothetical protein [Chitinophagaceae bacterium]HRG91953.1 hypothetical protein [Chitinophagaceae bacterium]